MSGVHPPFVLHEHTSCEILITNACNMACDYCIARDLPGPSMSVEIGQAAIDMFVYLAAGGKSIEFVFTGGEPLTQFNVLEQLTEYACERARMAGMIAHFVIKTNGSIINQEIIDFLRQKSIKVVVSIDGTQSVHDKHRVSVSGKATHALVRDNLQTLVSNQISCVAGVTVHPGSARLLFENVRYLSKLGLEEMVIGPAYGTVSWTEYECMELSRSLLDVAGYIHAMNRRGCRVAIEPLKRESEHVGGILSSSWGCHAGSKNLAFLPNGQVAGCSALAMLAHKYPDLLLGDVYCGLDQQAIDRLIGLAQAPGEERSACRVCKTAINCAGGCLAINYSTTGFAHTPPDVYCKTISTIPEAWRKAWDDTGGK